MERVRDGRNHSCAAPGFRQKPSGMVELGFTVTEVEAFYRFLAEGRRGEATF